MYGIGSQSKATKSCHCIFIYNSSGMTIILRLLRLLVYVGSIQVQGRCSNEGTVYIDGEFALNSASADILWTTELPWNASTIAVRCLKSGRWGGLIVSFSNGLVIGEDWLCADNIDTEWYTPTYNDSHWKSARVITSNNRDSRFPPYVQWVWSQDSKHNTWRNRRQIMHCRAKIGETISPICIIRLQILNIGSVHIYYLIVANHFCFLKIAEQGARRIQ